MAEGAASTGYDVFLSHSSGDAKAVRQVAEALTRLGLRVFFAEGGSIQAGAQWQEELQAALKRTRTFAFFHGAEIGYWAKLELQAALELRAEQDLHIVPVLLPNGAPDHPDLLFLKSFQWIDCRLLPWHDERLGEAPGFAALIEVISGRQLRPPEPPVRGWRAVLSRGVSRHARPLRLLLLSADAGLTFLCVHALTMPFVDPWQFAKLIGANPWFWTALVVLLVSTGFIWFLDPDTRQLKLRMLAVVAGVLRGPVAIYGLALAGLALGAVYLTIPPFAQVVEAHGRVPDLPMAFMCASIAKVDDYAIQGGYESRQGCFASGLEQDRFEVRLYTGFYRPEPVEVEIQVSRRDGVLPQVGLADAALPRALNVSEANFLRPRDFQPVAGHSLKVVVPRVNAPRRFSILLTLQYDPSGITDSDPLGTVLLTVETKVGTHAARKIDPEFEVTWRRGALARRSGARGRLLDGRPSPSSVRTGYLLDQLHLRKGPHQPEPERGSRELRGEARLEEAVRRGAL